MLLVVTRLLAFAKVVRGFLFGFLCGVGVLYVLVLVVTWRFCGRFVCRSE